MTAVPLPCDHDGHPLVDGFDAASADRVCPVCGKRWRLTRRKGGIEAREVES